MTSQSSSLGVCGTNSEAQWFVLSPAGRGIVGSLRVGGGEKRQSGWSSRRPLFEELEDRRLLAVNFAQIGSALNSQLLGVLADRQPEQLSLGSIF